jgi:hypothetical protein
VAGGGGRLIRLADAVLAQPSHPAFGGAASCAACAVRTGAAETDAAP